MLLLLSLLLPVRLRTLRIELQMISSDQEDSPAGRPLSDRTNIETAGEHDSELLAKKREEGRERTRLCRERKKAAKRRESTRWEHEHPLLAKRRADQRERTRLCRERKKGGRKINRQICSPIRYRGNTKGGKENQQADLLPNSLLGSSQTIQKSRKCGFGDVISLEIASDEFQNEATSRANKRGPTSLSAVKDPKLGTCNIRVDARGIEGKSTVGAHNPSLNNGEPSPLSAVTNLTAHKNQETDMGTINGDDESWLHRNDHFAPRPYGGMQNDHDSSCAIWDHEIQNVLQTAMSQEHNQGHGMAILDHVVQGEDHATPEDLQRAQWHIRTERSRKRKRGNQVNVADLQRNLEFQRKYHLRNTTQMKPQVTPSGNVNPSLGTVDHNHG
ncbi:hypothetical protein EJB05_57933, partial [Eragrostis curvula]